ncbi:branched-chain amino acid ABC transporter permease [Sulfobacillus harzensis]|uniref:Branched-chain amino acid ABC transporter permease n=1 Tax=Sulfobacillus harzensis TaxID=2729629 RepID=A0A7Y0Q346_9FIRM|nr:branched-chain amino acid ABC transporter permease [Sulfobacillus harzensis]NMP23838.1 branched-chain amino acid ABC transporter permease [Sulfobacillus harzensis]
MQPDIQMIPHAQPRRRRKIVPIAIWVGVLIVLGLDPLVLSPAAQFLSQTMIVFALFAVATNFLVGFSGLLSFGQAVFFGFGAYSAALLWTHGFPFWPGFIIAPFMAAGVAAFVAIVSLRTSRLYFALLTLGFSQLAYEICDALYHFTGGETGIPGINIPNAISAPFVNFEFVLVFAAAGALGLFWVRRSSFGLALQAIRENPTRAQAVGIHIYWHHVLAYVIAGFICGLAGVLYVVYQQQVNPALLNWTTSGEPVLMAVLGGMGLYLGPAIGSFIYVFLEQFVGTFTTQWPLLVGAVVLVLVLLYPKGFGGGVIDLIQFVRRRPRERREVAAGKGGTA